MIPSDGPTAGESEDGRALLVFSDGSLDTGQEVPLRPLADARNPLSGCRVDGAPVERETKLAIP